ncbi:hypothetical protein [Alicycliphilus denitrificans]|uniref:hypothetical protein n=1 Tax=Alicycliphilus denitrificans TaxID=179636 RepID=UPI001F2A541B|nr:hypothetical protein [Alicycliphilus denitrificans]
MSSTAGGGRRLKQGSSWRGTRLIAAASSAMHFSSAHRSPTTMAVVVTWRVKPLQTVGMLPASLSAYTTKTRALPLSHCWR